MLYGRVVGPIAQLVRAADSFVKGALYVETVQGMVSNSVNPKVWTK